MVKHKSGFVTIFIHDLHMPVAAISVQCGGNRGIAKRVNTFVKRTHKEDLANDYCVQFVVVQAKFQCSVILRRDCDGCSSFCLGRLDNIHRQHIIDVDFLKLLFAWVGSIIC